MSVFHVVVTDEEAYDQNGKLPNAPSLILSNYYHSFHTLLIPLQNLTSFWKPVGFSIFIHYTCSTSPCLEILTSCHRIQSSTKPSSNTHPSHFGIRTNNNPKTRYTKNRNMLNYHRVGRKRHVTEIFGLCASKLDGEMLTSSFWSKPK